jgi:hypothetical protein
MKTHDKTKCIYHVFFLIIEPHFLKSYQRQTHINLPVSFIFKAM